MVVPGTFGTGNLRLAIPRTMTGTEATVAASRDSYKFAPVHGLSLEEKRTLLERMSLARFTSIACLVLGTPTGWSRDKWDRGEIDEQTGVRLDIEGQLGVGRDLWGLMGIEFDCIHRGSAEPFRVLRVLARLLRIDFASSEDRGFGARELRPSMGGRERAKSVSDSLLDVAEIVDPGRQPPS